MHLGKEIERQKLSDKDTEKRKRTVDLRVGKKKHLVGKIKGLVRICREYVCIGKKIL